MIRTAVSEPPPAAKGTMKLMGLPFCGKSEVFAGAEVGAAAAACAAVGAGAAAGAVVAAGLAGAAVGADAVVWEQPAAISRLAAATITAIERNEPFSISSLLMDHVQDGALPPSTGHIVRGHLPLRAALNSD